MDQSTMDKLHEMRFPKMAEQYLLQSEDPEHWRNASFDERFASLVDAEYSNRIRNRRARLLKSAKLEQPHARIEEINYESGRNLDRRLINQLATCRYIDEYNNVFLIGATGSGKTYLACALGYEACQNDLSTMFVRLPDFLMEMSLARQDGSFIKAMKKYTQPKLLILDEWLLFTPKEEECKNIAELIHKRRKHSSTIFCSQYDENEWYEQLGGSDNPIADSILDRIIHNAYKIDIRPIDPDKDISMREVYGLKHR